MLLLSEEGELTLKYLVIVGDGMADYPMEEFGGKTALQYARTPNFNALAREGELGLVQTIPDGLPAGSDTANLSVLGYDPLQYYTGRSPFEAASLGVELGPTDVSFRCNLVTLSDEEPYAAKTMVDYCAGEISTSEADELIKAVEAELGTDLIRFYTGFQFRNLMVWKGAPDQWHFTPPHDISNQKIRDYLPNGPEGPKILELMEQSYKILAAHPVNRKRVERGLNPANSIWLWGDGKKPLIPSLKDKYGLRGTVVSAVDLVKGIGLFAGLKTVEVEGATGYIDTNIEGKVEAVLEALGNGDDFVFLHVEAPDECSHRFEKDNKIKAIEMIDSKAVGVLKEQLAASGYDFSILLITDHATPLSLGTHTREPVPFAIYRSTELQNNPGHAFDEYSASMTGILYQKGFLLMDHFLQKT
jgi:2,3-bisphosphoglycerate-independent phosphoglycerate mutase